MYTHPLLVSLRGGLLVSCQPDALNPQHDPLNRPEMMAAMAQAAVLGGAVAIRADSPAHIRAIRTAVSVPVIGIYKRDLPGYEVRITSTAELALQVAQAGADFVAVDATHRPRPEGGDAAGFIRRVQELTGLPVLADISTFEEGVAAAQAGAAAVLTTLSGYTSYSPQQDEPDEVLVQALAQALEVPVIAEGRVQTPEQAARLLGLGAWAVTVGSAITRPRAITERFVQALKEQEQGK